MIRSPLLLALFNPLNLLMLVGAVLAGLIAAWWLFPLGLLIWLMMVFVTLRDPANRLTQSLQNREPLSQRFQSRFQKIEKVQISLFNALRSVPSRRQAALQGMQDAVNRLVDECYFLCRAMTPLENYRLTAPPVDGLLFELQQMDAKIESAADIYVKKEYEETRRSKQERIEKIKSITNQLNRVDAFLESVASDLDGIMMDIIRLQHASRQQVEEQSGLILQKIDTLANEVRQFQQTQAA